MYVHVQVSAYVWRPENNFGVILQMLSIWFYGDRKLSLSPGPARVSQAPASLCLPNTIASVLSISHGFSESSPHAGVANMSPTESDSILLYWCCFVTGVRYCWWSELCLTKSVTFAVVSKAMVITVQSIISLAVKLHISVFPSFLTWSLWYSHPFHEFMFQDNQEVLNPVQSTRTWDGYQVTNRHQCHWHET